MKKLVNATPSGLKCGTHIFKHILKQTYSLMFGLSPFPFARENLFIDL